jgi:hypothetical protein
MSQIEVSERDRAHDIADAAWQCVIEHGYEGHAAVGFIEEALVGFGNEQRARGWNEAREAAAKKVEESDDWYEFMRAGDLTKEHGIIAAIAAACRALTPPTEPTGTGESR